MQHVKHIFLFNGKFYDPIDGVAMGSPLAPVLANLSWDITKNSRLKTFRGLHHPTIEDMLMIFFQFLIIALKQKNFLNYINTRHPNIKFTMETEVNKIIPFLDVFIDNSRYFKSFYLSQIHIFWFAP